MDTQNIKYDCSRGCSTLRADDGELTCQFKNGCCKLTIYDWLKGIPDEETKNLLEVRFKNTRKLYYKNESGISISVGDLVVVEATNGHDVGIVTACGPIIRHQLKRNDVDPSTFEFKKIYRKARSLDIERWQEAIAREHKTMIRARQIALSLDLNMKIGDVEFQGDGTKAIFYYIADERVDFRQLIRQFAEEFKIRIEMRQIGARQEAGLIGGVGVCGQELCCSRYMSNFQSITTQAARSQDLSLNPQKLAGQCSKLKCCINYEAATYIDALTKIPYVREPLETLDGPVFLIKTDILKGIMWFSYEQHGMANMFPIPAEKVIEILKLNSRGIKVESLLPTAMEKSPEFITAVGDDSISRFDEKSKVSGNRPKGPKKPHRSGNNGNNGNNGNGNGNSNGNGGNQKQS